MNINITFISHQLLTYPQFCTETFYVTKLINKKLQIADFSLEIMSLTKMFNFHFI